MLSIATSAIAKRKAGFASDRETSGKQKTRSDESGRTVDRER
jgi:hypothetical protein